MKKISIAIAALTALMCSCQPRLVILHTNDTHSHFEPVRSGEYTGLGGVVERAAFVDSIRNVYGKDKVLLVHAGDFSQGSSYFSKLNGQLEPAVINDMAYDCVTLGNHEFDNGIEAITQRLSTLEGTQVVCANIDVDHFELSKYVKPCTVIERGGMRVGFIGLETDLSKNVSKNVSSRFNQFDNVEVTNKWAEHLKKNEKCDLIILLSHLGYEEDKALVPSIHHVDLIIGGHSHTFVDDIVYVKDADGKKVGVVTDGCWGLQMGQINVR